MTGDLYFPSSHDFLLVFRYALRLARVLDGSIVVIVYSSRSHLVFVLQLMY